MNISRTVFLCLLACYAQTSMAQTFSWGGSIRGTDGTYATAVGTDSLGNVYCSGYFNGTTDCDPGPAITNLTTFGDEDVFLAKLDANNNFVWAGSMGGLGQDRLTGMEVDAAGYTYLTGYFEDSIDADPGPATVILRAELSRDVFAAKIDPQGNLVWARQFNSSTAERGKAIALDASGNVYLSGSFSDSLDADPGPGYFPLGATGSNNTFVIKLDPAGNLGWAKVFQGGSQNNHALEVDPLGNVLVTGFFYNSVDFDPGPGFSNLTAVGFGDGYLCKLDSAGNFVWVRQWEGDNANANFIASDGAGNIYATGYFYGAVDFDIGSATLTLQPPNWASDAFLTKLDSAGNLLWVHQWGGNGHDHGMCVTVDALHNVYISGKYTGAIDADPGPGVSNFPSYGFEDASLCKFDPAGNFVWGIGVGGTQANYGINMDLDPFGYLYLYGAYFGDTCDLDPGAGTFPVTPTGWQDVFLTKLDVCQPVRDTISPTVCDSFFAPSGQAVWTSSGTYQDTIRSVLGCDSLLTIQLSIAVVNTSVSVVGQSLQANATNASFQWLDCDSSFAAIPGATNATFTPASSGFYAVAVTQNGCTDTSACVDLTVVGLAEAARRPFQVSPNPTAGRVQVQLAPTISGGTLSLSNALGQVLMEKQLGTQRSLQLELPGPTGIYLLRLVDDAGGVSVVKVWKD